MSDTLQPQLLPHQVEGVAFLEACNGECLLADSQGLGKTITTLHYMDKHNRFPAVFLCPTSVKYNWIKEAGVWAPGRKFLALEGETPSAIPDDVDAVTINYQILASWMPVLMKWHFEQMIIDESHTLGDHRNKTTKAAIQVSRRAKHVMCLSGTPVGNRPRDFWATLHILKPREFPAFTPYGARYCGPKMTHWGPTYDGATNLWELHERIKPFTLRRKKDILGLPEQTIHVIPVEMDTPEVYQEEEANLLKEIRKNFAKRGGDKKKAGAAALLRVTRTIGLAARLKARNCVNYIREYKEKHPDRKVILFCNHLAYADVLIRRVSPGKALAINGTVKAKDRQAIIERFQTDPEFDTIVCNVTSANAGITLTAATVIFYCEIPWNPAKINQANDRNHRIGQDKECEIYFLVAKGTIEERICEVAQKKQDVSDQIIDGKPLRNLTIFDMLMEYDSEKGRV